MEPNYNFDKVKRQKEKYCYNCRNSSLLDKGDYWEVKCLKKSLSCSNAEICPNYEEYYYMHIPEDNTEPVSRRVIDEVRQCDHQRRNDKPPKDETQFVLFR